MILKFFIFIFTIFFSLSTISYAYLGIAPLIPLIGQAVVFIFLAIVVFFGLILYPFKILYSKFKKKKIDTKDKQL